MSAFIGSVVGNLITGLEWIFYSMPTWAWFALAAVAVVLGIWALGVDEFSELVSESRSFHSLASSFGMGYLFMLVTQAIHDGNWGYAFVTLAKNDMTFSAFDPSTWHFTFCVFMLLLLVSTLSAFFLAGGVSFHQIMLTLTLDVVWAVVVRILQSDGLALLLALPRFVMSAIIFFGTPVCMLISIVYLFSNPKKELQEERIAKFKEKHNRREMAIRMPTTLTLPNGIVVHKTPSTSSDNGAIVYRYEDRFRAFTVSASNIVTLPDGTQEILIKGDFLEETPDLHIPLPVKVNVKH